MLLSCFSALLCCAVLFVYASAKLPASTGIEMAIIHLTITVSQLENDIAFAHDSATDAELSCWLPLPFACRFSLDCL